MPSAAPVARPRCVLIVRRLGLPAPPRWAAGGVRADHARSWTGKPCATAKRCARRRHARARIRASGNARAQAAASSDPVAKPATAAGSPTGSPVMRRGYQWGQRFERRPGYPHPDGCRRPPRPHRGAGRSRQTRGGSRGFRPLTGQRSVRLIPGRTPPPGLRCLNPRGGGPSRRSTGRSTSPPARQRPCVSDGSPRRGCRRRHPRR